MVGVGKTGSNKRRAIGHARTRVGVRAGIGGVERGLLLGVARQRGPRSVGAAAAERCLVGDAGGTGKRDLGAELPGVLPANPRDVVGKKMGGPLETMPGPGRPRLVVWP